MRRRLLAATAVLFGFSSSIIPVAVSAQDAAATEAGEAVPITVEAYYRIRWGADQEFFALFERNHLPILQEAQARGIIEDIRIDLPYNHMVGGARWDLRVATTYRDANAALLSDPAFVAVFDEVVTRLREENPDFEAEETRRFSLLEEHWDVFLMPQP